jgi:hypothetical protein
LSSYTPISQKRYSPDLDDLSPVFISEGKAAPNWLFLTAAVILTSVPVFFQAPLVRSFPWLSLLMTLGWLGLGLRLRSHPKTHQWGDLLLGFTWTWLAGTLYWGWLRWEPHWHLPVEAIGLPFAYIGLSKQWGKVGKWFYMGSLLGTCVTDLYFYLVKLIPYWRQLMQVEPDLVQPIFQAALSQMQTSWGTTCALGLAIFLVIAGALPLLSRQPHWWVFGGSVLSTILVDGLFWFAATFA